MEGQLSGSGTRPFRIVEEHERRRPNPGADRPVGKRKTSKRRSCIFGEGFVPNSDTTKKNSRD